MKPQVTFVRDVETGDLVYGVVATNKDAIKVWDGLTEPVSLVMQHHIGPDYPRPTDPVGWTDLALLNQSRYTERVDPFEVENEAKGIKAVEDALARNQPFDAPVPTEREMNVIHAADVIERDHPGMLESIAHPDDDSEFDRDAMLNYVTMALGEIDPDGPNGWLLRAADGEPPAEGDYIHWVSEPREETQ